jgi:hypothetical protein
LEGFDCQWPYFSLDFKEQIVMLLTQTYTHALDEKNGIPLKIDEKRCSGYILNLLARMGCRWEDETISSDLQTLLLKGIGQWGEESYKTVMWTSVIHR